MASTKKQHTPPAAVASVGEPAAFVDPKFEWAEKAGSYVLRITLPGFRKADLRVQVDGAGRLTVRGTSTGTTTGQASLCKVFQLPSAASHDDIAGRFEAGVLTLTVPKRASSSVPAPTRIEEIRRKLPGVPTPKQEDISRMKQEEEASKSKQEQQKPAPTQANKEEEVKPKAPQATTAPPQEPAPVKKEEETKPKAPQAAAASTPPPEKPAPKPEAATGSEMSEAAVAPESMAEQMSPAKAAAGTAEKEATTEREKAAAAACVGGWKDRAMGDLRGLTNMKWAEGMPAMKWADGMVEAARNNKEVAAVCVAAFSVGFLVSQKLFRK